ncbi:MAG: adenylosuccinate lyase [Bacteroidales bacterium]|jgi:adenylosuccinate lyase|nr:adenylosuccinate lyase [Bacteroidales bacterium]MDD4001280.1 adenylosuccinate lyase [Bacteroidales bacterium]MDD4528489.1 adenylosuccinate lyase [Bacteroidales bacterium]MDD4829980.1 adenylosuccinate lyase [Bacteroidales bacterium]
MNSLFAISPIDGRYRKQVEPLANYFSEKSLIYYRTRIEIEYFIALCNIPLEGLDDFDKSNFEALRDIYRNFSENDALEVKDIEKTTNHDVKAVEYLIKRRFSSLGLDKWKEFIHFGLTSQDINNTSVPLSMKECQEDIYLPLMNDLIDILEDRATQFEGVPMLAHTHGQPASPTMLSKEIRVFIYRIKQQLAYFAFIPFGAKFGGATGNFNAHKVTFPQHNWVLFANNFCSELGLERQTYTTQIENYDNMAAYFDNIRRINVILMDFCKDMWAYISMEYFKQKIKEGEVGSSAMPHKVNPIDFENAEGNLGMANAIFDHLSTKLPISRLQRDLTDSTVTRNIGVPIAHTIIALNSIIKGVNKLLLNKPALERDLNNNWPVVAEAIQSILRSIGYPNAYEALKDLTRTNTEVNAETIAKFVDGLDVSDQIKQRMKLITPMNYVGVYE